MSKTPLLGINEVAENQNNKYLTINNAINALTQATNKTLSIGTIGAGPVNLTEDDATRNVLYRVSGGSAPFNLVFPSKINGGLDNAKRVFAVVNDDATYAVTIKASTGTGTTVVLAPAESALIVQDYENVGILLFGAAGSAVKPYDIGVFIPGTTTNNQLIVQTTVVRPFKFSDDFSGSDGNVGTNPTAAATFTVKRNGTTIGTVVFSTAGVPTFATSGTGDENFVAGDVLSITSQATADATMADISITLLGARV